MSELVEKPRVVVITRHGTNTTRKQPIVEVRGNDGLRKPSENQYAPLVSYVSRDTSTYYYALKQKLTQFNFHFINP